MTKGTFGLGLFLLFIIVLPSTVLAEVNGSLLGQLTENEASVSTEVLSTTIVETIAVLENGSCEMSLLINVSSSPLTEMYRRSLGAPVDVDVDEEIPIPENITLWAETETGESATHIVIPVREEFHKSLEHQQQLSLGLVTAIFDSRMVPRSSDNGCRVSIDAFASFPILSITQIDSDYKWEIGVGPQDHNTIGAAAGFAFTNIELIQMMLESLPGEQLHECFWSTRIELPTNTKLLNRDVIAGLNWKIDFGGGTYMSAMVSFDESTIVIDETTVVTEQKVVASPRYLLAAFSSYKTFIIEYLSPHSSSGFHQSVEPSPRAPGDTWFYPWTAAWSDSISVPFSYGPLNALLTVSASITLSGYVGWEFGLLEGLTSFESWMSLDASVDVSFEATATTSYSKTWEKTLFQWSTTFSFWVGVVPVWADFEITATGFLSVDAHGELLITAGASASCSLKAGVRWTSDYDWTYIWEVSKSASYSDPTIDAKASVWIRPSVKFRLAFLFYSVAGPFVEFEPYATATLTCSYPPPYGTWLITANLKVVAGATFAGWLKSLLGLDNYERTVYDEELERWSGSWGPSSISISETLDPSTSSPSGAVRVYGEAVCNDETAVSYTDVIVTITQTGASWTTTTDSDGDYSQYISAPTTEKTYTVQVDITTGSLSGSNSKPLTVKKEPDGGSYTLSRTTTCKDVQSSSPYDPIDECEVFRRTDSISYTWVHLTNVYKSLNVKWEWYKPDGSYYTYCTYTVPDPGSQGYDYWAWYKCWCGIYISGHTPADMEGRWHSKVYIDEGGGYIFKAVEEFVIGYEVTDRTMAKDVQTSDPYEPIDRTNSFLNTDPKALAWIRLDEVAESLEIKWEWYDPSGAKYFEFPWTTPDPGSGCSYWDWYKYWCYIYISGHEAQSKLGSWEVRAYIQDVYGNWDLEYSQYFTISDNTPPGTPGTPVDDGDYSTDGTVTWTWTPASEDGAVAKYQIQVGTTCGGNDIYDGYISDLSKTLTALPSGSTYYARVRAMNTVGQWGPWSPCSNGITVDRPPVTIIVEGPSGNITYNDVAFTWKGSDDVTPTLSLVYSYYLEGYDPDWSLWGSSTSKQYNDLSDGYYTFLVKAKDQIGNEDPTPANRSFTVIVIYNIHLESREDTDETENLGTIRFSARALTMAERAETAPEVAEKAAMWVVSEAEIEGGGFKWPDYSMGLLLYPASYYGASGVGTFLLKLYQNAGNETYLQYAKGAAQWICHAAVPENGGYKWPHPDRERHSPGWWLSPDVAEIGEFLLKMHVETGNQTYLDYAKGAAQWLISMRVKSDTVGYFVPYNPPGKYGSQAAMGISPGRESHTVVFLLHMYQQTGNTSYLQSVEEMATWLIGGAEKGYALRHQENGGYKWLSDIPYFVGKSPTTDFPLGVTAEVALFFLEAYSVLGNETYLENAKGAVQWLLSQAVGGSKWPIFPGETRYYLVPWQTYPNHIMDLLTYAYAIADNSTYLGYASQHTNWMIKQAVAEDNGYKFPYYEGDATYNPYHNALCYAYLRMMFEQTGNSTYLEYAEGVKQWLINNATAGNPGLKWAVLPNTPYYNPCWYGNTGIGYYLAQTSLPYDVSKPAGTYDIEYTPAPSYLFDHWETAGGISVSNATDNPTEATVTDNGTLRAVYARAPDIAVTNVTTSKTVVGQGYNLSINVTVENQGSHTETFNVTAYYNTNPINTTEVTLTSGSSTIITFTWNTTGVPYGNYTITANATQIPGEIDTPDNEYVDGWVVVTIPGDITGEHKVDHKDLLLLASAYGSEVGEPRYIPEADIDGSGKVDHKDLLILAANYGKET